MATLRPRRPRLLRDDLRHRPAAPKQPRRRLSATSPAPAKFPLQKVERHHSIVSNIMFVLVTVGHRFIGGTLCLELLHCGMLEVRSFNLGASSWPWQLLYADVDFFQGNVKRYEEIDRWASLGLLFVGYYTNSSVTEYQRGQLRLPARFVGKKKSEVANCT